MSKRPREEDEDQIEENHHSPSTTTDPNNFASSTPNYMINSPLPRYCDYPTCENFDLFHSYDSYHSHYQTYHSNKCPECLPSKVAVFPDEFLMELHIEENHDMFWQIKKEQQTNGIGSYRCLNKFCQEKFEDPSKRKRHMIREHGYPETYDFEVVQRGLKI